MRVLGAIESGWIYPAEGRPITREQGAGKYYRVTSVQEARELAAKLVAEHRYAGGLFLGWDDQVPNDVPQHVDHSIPGGTRCWAEAVLCETGKPSQYEWAEDLEPIGCLVLWATEETEAAYRQQREAASPVLTFEEFNSARHGDE